MRRSLSLVVMAVAVLIPVAACGEGPGGGAPASDVVYLRAGGGVAVVDPGANAPSYKETEAVPSTDWSTIVRTDIDGRTTAVIATDPVTGKDKWRDVIEGRYTANVVSRDGDLVALSPVRERYYGYGRSQTEFVIAGDGIEQERHITVDGNFEPEAFSSDGSNLFVVSYLPARAPTKYQVRRLDLTTGTVEGVFTPHEELQGPMGGTARIQTASPDGSRLYTLYTTKDEEGLHAFIHVLDLENLWAHCIDLPDEFASMAESSTALAVAPDGRHLYAANTSSGSVVEIATDTMLVERAATFDFDSRGRAHATVDTKGNLYVASGPWVVAIDTDELVERDRWAMNDAVKGLQGSSDAANLYVGVKNQITTLNVDDGTTKEIDLPGIRHVGRLGPVLQPAVEEEPILKCAC